MAEAQEGVFEIQDFTIATDLENFIANIEKTLRKWEIQPNLQVSLPCMNTKKTNSSPFIVQKEIITFDDYHGSFHLGLYKWNPQEDQYSIPNQEELYKSLHRQWEEEYFEIINPIYLQTDVSLLAQTNLFKFIHWYNCKEFLLLQPTALSFGNGTLSQSQTHLLLSSLITALNNCQR